jgi:hypothetical protein
VDIVRYMVYKDVIDHNKIWALINAYYKEPDKTVEQARKVMKEGGLEVGA